MEGKKKNSLLLIGVATLIVALIGASFAYFTASVTNNSTPISVTTTELANLTMTSIKSSTEGPIYPGWVGFQGIDVNATGSGNAIYDLTLTITGGTNIKNDVQVSICKVENSNDAISAGDFTYTAATPVVSNNQYSMSGGSITLPSPCTSVVSQTTLNTLGPSVKISSNLGKEIVSGKHDKYYIAISYLNRESAQTQGETFTITPSISAKAELDVPIITCETTPDSGNYETCNPSSMTVGQRVKIGNDANAQYFRYLRTTDTLSQLNECGTSSSSACLDTATSTVGIPGAGYVRLLAEYNLMHNGNGNNATIASTALQNPASYLSYTDAVKYSNNNSSEYSTSLLKVYVENYATLLNNSYGISAIGSSITKAELVNLGCPSTGSGSCSNAYPWIYSTAYWTGSSNVDSIWVVDYEDGLCIDEPDLALYASGVRPIIQIAVSDF